MADSSDGVNSGDSVSSKPAKKGIFGSFQVHKVMGSARRVSSDSARPPNDTSGRGLPVWEGKLGGEGANEATLWGAADEYVSGHEQDEIFHDGPAVMPGQMNAHRGIYLDTALDQIKAAFLEEVFLQYALHKRELKRASIDQGDEGSVGARARSNSNIGALHSSSKYSSMTSEIGSARASIGGEKWSRYQANGGDASVGTQMFHDFLKSSNMTCSNTQELLKLIQLMRRNKPSEDEAAEESKVTGLEDDVF